MTRRPPRSTLFPYTPLFLSADHDGVAVEDLRLDPATPPEPDGAEVDLEVPVTLVGTAAVEPADQHELYRPAGAGATGAPAATADRKSTRLNSSHANISYAAF